MRTSVRQNEGGGPVSNRPKGGGLVPDRPEGGGPMSNRTEEGEKPVSERPE